MDLKEKIVSSYVAFENGVNINSSIFEKSVTTREGNKPFLFFEGPPSVGSVAWKGS